MNPSGFYVDPYYPFGLSSGLSENKKALRYCLLGLFFDWLLDYQDSNLDKQNQNLLCYHYTIVQTSWCFPQKTLQR